MSLANARPSRANLWADQVQNRIAGFYDQFATDENRIRFEQLMVSLAVIGFLIHLAVIFICQAVPQLAGLRAIAGTNYLAAIYTPFSFILFYEVLLLVLTIPESTTLSMGTQFEIISLITIRNVFEDLAEFESLSNIQTQLDAFTNVLLDMGGGLALFLLVTGFYHVNRWRTPQEQALTTPSAALQRFIARKKIVALVLSLLFFGLAAGSVWTWSVASYDVVVNGAAPDRSLTTIFYTDLFTVMIFTDVLLLVLSLPLSDRYQLVFRNAGFVVATILLRIAIAASRPYNLIVAVIAALFGILLVAIYKYCSLIGATHDLHRPHEH